MAYDQNIPQATDRIKDSQSALLANFQAIKTLIDINHETFGSANEGKHKFVQLPEQGSAPSTAANEGAVYTAVGATSTVTELLFRRESNGSAIPMTEYKSVSSTNGWTYLPSGIIMKWGEDSFTAASTTVSINGFGPNYAGTPWTAIITTVQVSGGSANDFDRTAFFKEFSGTDVVVTKKGSSNTCIFKYLIIGI